ncbi:hypothetical protein TWF696_004370 [Orbilia brochopaga]|uniref:Uncharacterized protein n=1 Tax=Orbilia brochopaga TaxID=3140254 RepID=A0AAV9V8D6_9PEZI
MDLPLSRIQEGRPYTSSFFILSLFLLILLPSRAWSAALPTSKNPKFIKRAIAFNLFPVCEDINTIIANPEPERSREIIVEDGHGGDKHVKRPDYRALIGKLNSYGAGYVLQLRVDSCKNCLCDENGEMQSGHGVGLGLDQVCNDATLQRCKYWYGCYCERRQESEPEPDVSDAVSEAALEAISEHGYEVGSEAGPSTQHEQPRYHPSLETIDELSELEMSTNRQEVEGTNEPYEIEGPSRSRRGTWDWFRRMTVNIGRAWGVREIIDRTVNRAHGRLRGGRGSRSKPSRWRGPHKGLRKRGFDVDVYPDDYAIDTGEGETFETVELH